MLALKEAFLVIFIALLMAGETWGFHGISWDLTSKDIYIYGDLIDT